MTHSNLDAILDECLARLAAGESVDACLQVYPVQQSELKPLLELAVGLRALPQPQPGAAAFETGKQRLLAAYRLPRSPRGLSGPGYVGYAERLREFFLPRAGFQAKHVLRFAAAILLVLFVGTNLAVVASAGTIPGDPLYGVKRSWEDARMTFALREENRLQLKEQFLLRRAAEVSEMRQRGRLGVLEIEGILQSSGDGRWSVDGLTFQLTPETRLEGDLRAGAAATARVQLLEDGILVALRVSVRPAPLLIEADPRRTPDPLRVMATEWPENTPTAGVSTELSPAPDGSSTSAPSRTPEPSDTPVPARSPEAGDTPASGQTPCPQCTAQPPDETHEPRPTLETREPDHTPEPSPTYKPTYSPMPTRTREPDRTPEPEETREPEHTPVPTESDEPDDTPAPTETKRPPQSPTPVATGQPPSTAVPTASRQRTPEPTHALEERTPTPPGSGGTPTPGGTAQSTPHD